MRYLHAMIRVKDLKESLKFYCDILGLIEVNRRESEKGRFTLVFLTAPLDKSSAQNQKSPLIELTWNWDTVEYTGGRNFGHLAFEVDHIYDYCKKLIKAGIVINRPPRDGYMAFIKSPNDISIELLQKGDKLQIEEPWASMENSGNW